MYSSQKFRFLLKRLVLLIGAIVIATFDGSAQTLTADTQDSLTLLQFRAGLQQVGWTVVWDITKPVASWQGVELNPGSGEVAAIYLKEVAGGGYEGAALPSSVGGLSQLKSLESFYAQQMNLISIPPEIGQLKSLKALGLNYNTLTQLPSEVSGLTKLTTLLIGNNALTALPDLHTLTGLTNLSISQNPFPVFPETVCDLVSLQRLQAYYSSFTVLPETISKLVNLEYLDLKYGKLVAIPASISSLKKLKELEIDRNNIQELPTSMGSLSSLNKLTASFNQIISFPAELAGLPSLTFVDLRDNKLSGPIPPEIWNRVSPKRVQLDVTNNQLSGPLVISNPAVVQTLRMSGNRFLLNDIFPVYSALKTNGATVVFTPQALVGTFRTFYPAIGEHISFQVDNSFTAPVGSKFTWYRSTTISPFEVSVKVTEQSSLEIASYVPASHDGVYFCKVTHPDMPAVEQESERVRLITKNTAPSLQVVDVTGKDSPTDNFQVNTIAFRQGTSVKVWVWAYGTDDFTRQQDLRCSFPESGHLLVEEAETSDYSARKLIIKTKDIKWSGTDTLKITVMDEHGLSTTHTIVVHVAPEINSAPVIESIPSVYMKEEFLPCENCQAFWIYESLTTLDQFIYDDLDNTEGMIITIPQEDIDDLNVVGLNANVYNDPFTKVWKLSVSGVFEQDMTFSHTFRIVVTDGDGAQTAGFVVVEATPSNDAPAIDDIAEQVISVSMEHFPDIDLRSFSRDDHSSPENLAWRVSSPAVLTVDLRGAVAKVSPFENMPLEADVTYTVYEKTNELLFSSRTIRYRVLNSGFKITGRVVDEDQRPLANVVFDGFSISTDANGIYTVTVGPEWSGILKPKLPSYSFTPEVIQVNNVQSDLAGRNFTGVYRGEFAISGFIRDNLNNPVSAITLNGFPEMVVTDVNGYYYVDVPKGWSGVITPNDDHYTFYPLSITIPTMSMDLSGQNFSAAFVTGSEAHPDLAIMLHPNPSYDGKFILEWSGHLSAELTICSVTGSTVFQKVIHGNEITFSLPGKGMFMMKLVHGQEVYIRKIVVR